MVMKRIAKGIMEKVAIRIAISDANTACPFISYQPKLPEAVKKMKK